MSRRTRGAVSAEIGTPLIVVVVVLVVVVLGYFAWRTFAPPPDPMANMTMDQKVQAIRDAQKNLHPRNPNPGGVLNRGHGIQPMSPGR